MLAFLRDRAKWDRRRRFIVWLLTVATLINLALLSSILWFGFLEPPWLTLKNQPYPVATAHVGGPILITLERCNSDDEEREYSVTRRLIRLDLEQPDIVLPAGISPAPAGCTKEISRRNSVPADTPPGRYLLRGTDTVRGTWRVVRIRWRSQPFDILPAK